MARARERGRASEAVRLQRGERGSRGERRGGKGEQRGVPRAAVNLTRTGIHATGREPDGRTRGTTSLSCMPRRTSQKRGAGESEGSFRIGTKGLRRRALRRPGGVWGRTDWGRRRRRYEGSAGSASRGEASDVGSRGQGMMLRCGRLVAGAARGAAELALLDGGAARCTG